MDIYIKNVLNANDCETDDALIKKVNSLIYVYSLIKNNSSNQEVINIAKRRVENIKAHYRYVDINNYNALNNESNGLSYKYNNAINILCRGLNEFNCSNALRELLGPIKEEPYNILYQTIIQIISDAERSTR